MRATNPTRRFPLVVFAAVVFAVGAATADPSGDKRQGGEAVVIAHPSVVDVGRVPTCSSFHWTLRLINAGADPRRVERVLRRGECGATKIPGIARDYLLQTRAPLELKIPQRKAVFPGPISEKIFVLFEDHPRLEVQMKGEAVTFVTVQPQRINPNNTDGRVVVRSRDGEPFRILRVLQPFIEPPPEGASAEHFLHLDWRRWCERGRTRRMLITTDHPLCRRAYARLKCGSY
jgi:hypothetical protein